MIPANELLAMQQEVANSLDLVATVQRNANKGTTDSNFAQSESWQPVAGLSAVGVSMHAPNNSALQVIAEQITDLVTWEIDLPMIAGAPADIRLEDQILVSGQTLRVIHVASPESNQMMVAVLAGVVKV